MQPHVPTSQTPLPSVPATPQLAEAKPGLPPLNPADREVAMNIMLNPAIPPPALAQGGLKPIEEPKLPYATSFVPQVESAPKIEGLRLKDVEILVAATGDHNYITTDQVPGRANAWVVRATMTPAQFRGFAAKLRDAGISPAPAVVADAPASEESKDRPLPPTRNQYDISHGKQWLKPIDVLIKAVPAAQAVGTSASAGRSTPPVDAKKPSPGNLLTIRILVEQVDASAATNNR